MIKVSSWSKTFKSMVGTCVASKKVGGKIITINFPSVPNKWDPINPHVSWIEDHPAQNHKISGGSMISTTHLGLLGLRTHLGTFLRTICGPVFTRASPAGAGRRGAGAAAVLSVRSRTSSWATGSAASSWSGKDPRVPPKSPF